jgi:hypothetical protein
VKVVLIFSVLMFLTAALFLPISVSIYRGKTDFIQSHHQGNVKDKAAYAKAFGKAFSLIPLGASISGVVGLIGDSDAIAAAAVVILVMSLLLGIGCIFAVQKKYNREAS